MRKKHCLPVLILLLLWSGFAYGQSRKSILAKKIDQSALIVEGRIKAQRSFWNAEKTFIYTAQEVEVRRLLKGVVATQTVEVLSPGGTVGDTYIRTSDLDMTVGSSGIFFARKNLRGEFELPPEGFIEYDKFQRLGISAWHLYEDLEAELVAPIAAQTGQAAHIINQKVEVLLKRPHKSNRRTSAIEITSLVPATVTAGTKTKLTINGSGFGPKKGDGHVIFTAHAKGGKTTFTSYRSSDLISWTDTKIEVYVPSEAGTGRITVVNNAGESFQSFNPLEVTYAVHNRHYFQGRQMISAGIPYLSASNPDGGYTLFADPSLFTTPEAMALIRKALNRWRCETGINVRLAANQKPIDFYVAGKSAIAMVEGKFSAPSYAYGEYEICNTGSEQIARLRHFKIFLNQNADYSVDGTPEPNERDAYSEMLHLFGKMGMLENVNDPNDLMYYNIPMGQTRTISKTNLEAAKLVIEQSKNMPNDCEWIPMRLVNKTDCEKSLSPPEARFKADKTAFCEVGGKVFFENTARNVSEAYWEFEGGTPATSDRLKSVKVTYNTKGVFKVKLTVKNPAGQDILEKKGFIKVGQGGDLSAIDLGADKTVCQGKFVTLKPFANPPADAIYQWSNGASTPTITVNRAGTYHVNVSQNGCEATDSVKVINEGVTVDAGPSPISCGGDPVQLSATQIKGATYKWSPAEGLSDPNIYNPIVLKPENNRIYTVTVNTGGKCEAIKDSLRINVEKRPVMESFPDQDTVRFCGKQGTLNAYAGQQVTYEWSDGFKYSYKSIEEPGLYWVEVTSKAGCKTRDSVVVEFTDTIDLQVTGDTLICAGEPFTLSASGGQTYQWAPKHAFKNPYGAKVTGTLDESTEITVTAYSGTCKAVTKTLRINVIPKPRLNILYYPDTIAVASSDSIRFSNYYQPAKYLWSTGDTTPNLTVKKTGTYSVTMTPSPLCGSKPFFKSIFVFFAKKQRYQLGKDTLVCGSKKLLLDPFTIDKPIVGKVWTEWSTGATTPTIEVTKSGDYWVKIADEYGNDFIDTLKVTFNRNLEAPFAKDTLWVCEKTALLDAKNEAIANYLWSDGSKKQTLEVSESGVYKVKISAKCDDTAVNDAPVEDSLTVIFVGEKQLVDLGEDTLRLCNAPYTLRPKNTGYKTFLWSDKSTADSLVVNESGLYTLTATDHCGRESADTIHIIFHVPQPIDLGEDTIKACQAPVLLDAGNTGKHYKWSDGSEKQTLQVHTSGKYSVSVTDSCGKVQQDSIEVIIHQSTLDLGKDTVRICSGTTTFDATLPNAKKYLWSDGSTDAKITVSKAGTYTVTVTDSCNLLQTDSVVLLLETPKLDLGKDTILVCEDHLILDAQNPGGSFEWSDGSTQQTLKVTKTGEYSVSLIPKNCTERLTDTVFVVFPTTTVDLGEDTIRSCEKFVTLDAGTQTGKILWSDGSTAQTLRVTKNGVYSLSVTDQCGRKFTDKVQVLFFEKQVLDLGKSPRYLCENTLTLDAGKFKSYLWSDGSTNQTLTTDKDGEYIVTVTDNCGNAQTDTVMVSFFKHASLGFTEKFGGEGKFTFTPQAPKTFGALSYHWDFGDGKTSDLENPSHVYQKIGEYQVKLAVKSENCGKTLEFSKKISVAVSGLQDDIFAQQITVSPNPTRDGKVNLHWQLNNALRIAVLDKKGRKLQSQSYKANTKAAVLDLSDYPAGIYYLRFVSKGKQATKKLLKQ